MLRSFFTHGFFFRSEVKNVHALLRRLDSPLSFDMTLEQVRHLIRLDEDQGQQQQEEDEGIQDAVKIQVEKD